MRVEPVTRYRFADGTSLDAVAPTCRAALAALEAWSPGAGADWVRFLGACARDVARVGARSSRARRRGRRAGRRRASRRRTRATLLRVRPWRTLRDLARATRARPAAADGHRALRDLRGRRPAARAGGARRRRLRRARLRRLAPARRAVRARAALVRAAARRSAASCARHARRALGVRRAAACAAWRRADGASPPTPSSRTSTTRRARPRLLGRRARRPRERVAVGPRADARPARRTPGLAHHADPASRADYDAEFDDVFVAPPAACATRRLRQRAVRDRRRAPRRDWFVLVNAPAGAGADWDAEADAAASTASACATASSRGRVARPPTSSARPARRRRDLRRARRTAGWARCAGPATGVRGVAGLWLAGGTVHPGGGLPLVTLGARRRAEIGPVSSAGRVRPRSPRRRRARSARTAPPSTSRSARVRATTSACAARAGRRTPARRRGRARARTSPGAATGHSPIADRRRAGPAAGSVRARAGAIAR